VPNKVMCHIDRYSRTNIKRNSGQNLNWLKQLSLGTFCVDGPEPLVSMQVINSPPKTDQGIIYLGSI
jgi:hypothetical protein